MPENPLFPYLVLDSLKRLHSELGHPDPDPKPLDSDFQSKLMICISDYLTWTDISHNESIVYLPLTKLAAAQTIPRPSRWY